MGFHGFVAASIVAINAQLLEQDPYGLVHRRRPRVEISIPYFLPVECRILAARRSGPNRLRQTSPPMKANMWEVLFFVQGANSEIVLVPFVSQHGRRMHSTGIFSHI